jgi:hypothetical protein
MGFGVGLLCMSGVLFGGFIFILKLHNMLPSKVVILEPRLIEETIDGTKKYSDPTVVWSNGFETYRKSWTSGYADWMSFLLWVLPLAAGICFSVGMGSIVCDLWK